MHYSQNASHAPYNTSDESPSKYIVPGPLDIWAIEIPLGIDGHTN